MTFRGITARGRHTVSKQLSNVFEYFCLTECFRALIAIKHDFVMLRSSGGVETLDFQARVFKIPFGSSSKGEVQRGAADVNA